MSEEEAIENLKHIVEYWEPDDENDELANIEYNSIKVAVNLIDKLLKENEDMREELQMYVDTDVMILQKELKDSINARFELQRRIDKIKEALGDKNIPDEMILTYIETLVSENARLEDIEDRKVQIEYNNVFNKGVKSVEDKIRDKIKELERCCSNEPIIIEYQIKVLKELLGDE